MPPQPGSEQAEPPADHGGEDRRLQADRADLSGFASGTPYFWGVRRG